MAGVRTDKVVCYFANPKTGLTEKHELWAIDFDEAARGHVVERRRVLSGEEKLWTLEPPKGVKADEIVDLTPVPFEVKAMDSAGPPAVQRQSLRG